MGKMLYKTCDICSQRNAKLLLKQPTKGTLTLDVCPICFERWQRLHYDTIRITDEDVIGIDEGKPVFRDGLFPNRKVLYRYKLERLKNVI